MSYQVMISVRLTRLAYTRKVSFFAYFQQNGDTPTRAHDATFTLKNVYIFWPKTSETFCGELRPDLPAQSKDTIKNRQNEGANE